MLLRTDKISSPVIGISDVAVINCPVVWEDACINKAGEVVLDLKSKGYGPKNWPSDVSQIQENKISLTPVEPDLFWRGNLDNLPKINNSFVNPS